MSLRLSNIINFDSFRSEAKEWKIFGKAFLLIVAPPLLVLLVTLEVVGWRLGETMPFALLTKRQIENPDLVVSAQQRDLASFKLMRIARDRPDILFMGNSRMGQFRGPMFNPYSFYNFSRVAWPIGASADLLSHLPEGYSPKVIFFSLDFFLFAPRYSEEVAGQAPIFYPSSWWNRETLEDHFFALNHVFDALTADPKLIWTSSREPYYQDHVTGLQAHIDSQGFRKDGSEQFPAALGKIAGQNPELFNSFHLGKSPFYYADKMGDNELTQFEEFVSVARARGFTLVGIQMPIYGPAARAIEQDPNYGILKDFRAHVADGYFDRQGIIVFDFMDFPDHGDDYRYFYDVLHPGEVLNVAVLLKMMANPRVKALLPNLDTAALQRELEENQNADHHIYLYPNRN